MLQAFDRVVCCHPPICNRYELVKHATNPENYVKDAGLKHTEHSRLTEWHFPGDMALVDDTVGGLQIMTDSVVC